MKIYEIQLEIIKEDNSKTIKNDKAEARIFVFVQLSLHCEQQNIFL